MEQSVKPRLKITGLHIEGLKALRRVDWPADGMGWGGKVPDLVMVGGVNGSGKTTLLEFIADAARMLRGDGPVMWWNDSRVNAWIDLRFTSNLVGDIPYRVVVGDRSFVQSNMTDACTHFTRSPTDWDVSHTGDLYTKIHAAMDDRSFLGTDFPRIAYFPTDRRLEIPDESFKAAGDIEDKEGFYYRFRAAKEWKESLGAVLYGARWADLNAKEEGHPENATNFESYDRAFQAFFGDTKRLTWHEGKLYVKIDDTGALHPLMELSSGEKQALILAAELYRRWRPGSLILIDEPELHFHPSWQTTLWLMLEKWQKERGGQVIVTTQSTHLFGIAGPGTTLLLGKGLA
jgi:ABC-type branched-subunit amino acid transport system ATPase component